MGGLRHPGMYALAALAGFVAGCVVASRTPIARWELRTTVWINDAPDIVADVLYLPMQLGTLAACFLVALLIVVFRRDWLLAAATVVVGFVAWSGAKFVKSVVERGRPRQYLPDILVHEGTGDGLGFISGHSAVVAALAVMAMAALPNRLRPLSFVLVLVVGVTRIVFGVHLPADVIGGWCFGVLLALGGLWVVDRIHQRLVAAAEVGEDSPLVPAVTRD